MKQKLFKCLTSNTMSSVMSSVMSRVSNECRMTLDRVSTLLLLLFALSFGFNQEAKASTDYVVGVAATNSNNYDVILNINRQIWGWYTWTMSKAGITFEGKKLYIQKYETDNGWINNFQILLKQGSTQREYKEFYSGSGSQGYYNNYVLNYDDKNAYSQLTMSKSKIYFNATGWDQTTIKLVVGHANFQKYYQMNKITNTKLYYVNPDMSWSDAMGFGVVGGTSASDGANWLTNVSVKAKEYTGFLHYGLNNNSDNVMYYVTNAGSTGQKPTCDYHSDYTVLNKTQTIKVMVKKAGASSYTETTFDNWPATIKAKRYKLNSNGASLADATDANLTSATFTSVITSAAKIYVPTPNTGYTFKGWGTSSSATPSNATSAYEYTVDDTKTIYLFFSENTYSITATADPTAGGTVTPTTATAMGQISGGNITATNNTGYYFVNWTLGTATGTFGSSITANTTFKPTQAGTVVANFAENTHNITISNDGNGSTAPTGQQTVGEVTGISITATPKDGYGFKEWVYTGGTISAQSATTIFKPTADNATIQATFQSTAVYYDLTVGVCSSQSATQGTVSSSPAASTHIQAGTAFTLTATPATGYEVEGWYSDAACTGAKLQPGGNTYTFSLSATMGVYVKFKEKTFSVTVQAGTGIDQVTGGGAAIGQLTGTAITATVKSGYTWSTWTGGTGTYVNGATVKDNTFRPTAASTLTATATENKYNVTINTNLPAGASLKFGSTAKDWGSVANVGIDSKQDITVTLNAGYTYDGAFSTSGGARVSGSGSFFTVWADGADGTVTVNIKEDLSSNWYLAGTSPMFPNGWNTGETNMMKRATGHSTENVYYFTIHVDDKDIKGSGHEDSYQFKIRHYKTGTGACNDYFGWSTGDTHYWVNKTCSTGVYKSTGNDNNLYFIPTIAGDYEFKVDATGTDPELTVTWPIYNCVYGAFNDWSKEDNKLNFGDGDEASTVVNIIDVSKSYEFLVLVNSNYLTNNTSYTTPITRNTASEVTFAAKGGSDNNAKFTPDVVGDYTFTYNKSTNKLTITYPTAYKVTFSATEGASGNVSATVDAHSIASGDYVLAGKDVTFTAPAAATDYHFVRWIDGNGDELSTNNPYTVSNISSDVTVKAVYGGTTYAVTISSDAQGEVTPSGVQQVDNIAGLEITATATTPGYVFNQWVVTGGATVTNNAAPTTTVKATGVGTVKATYKQAQVVYFKNTLGWSNVYVYIFNQANVMDATYGVNPKNSSRVAYGQMTLAQGETDVYVYTYDGALENMKSIAFSKDDQHDYTNFDNTQASYRGDYSAANPMFVPQTTSNESKNVSEGHETKYFNNGTWFPFSRDKHYYIQFENDDNQYPLVFDTEGSLNATITTKNLAAYSTYRFFLYDNAHPIDAQPVSYGREEVITYDKDNTFVSFTNSSTMATVQTITGGDHVFIANFNADVRPQINIDFPAAYTFDYGVGPGGKSATAVRTGTTDTIASGDYVAPEQSVTVTQTAADGCTFGQWNTQADGMGTNLGTDARYIFDMPASAHAAYALYNGADVPSSFQILGTFNNWASSSYMRSKSIVGELVYDSIYLDAGREYQFKVYNSAGSKWYGNTGIMTQAHCTQWTFTEHTDNCTLATTIAGWYKFTLNKSSISLNVTFPENPKQATMYNSPVKDNNTDVMIQAFYWAHNGNTSTEYTAFGDVKWAKLNNEADTLAKYFDMVWLAPSQETADYTGYLPINYSNQGTTTTADGHSPWGSSTDLRNLIDHLHNGGSKVIADIVINHSSAAHADEYSGNSPNWCTWGTFDFGRYGVFNPDYTWLAKGDEMFYGKKSQAGDCGLLDNTDNETDEWDYSYMGGTASWTESEFNCAYSRDWAHKKQEVREMSRAYLSWMRDSIGYDGWRYDFVKGFHGSHIYDYNRSTGAYFSVCEVFDGNAEKQIGVLSDAGKFTYMFDFPGKFSIYNSAIREYRLQNLKGNFNTLLACNEGKYKKYAVTFIDNHDSFHEGSCLYGTANTIDDRQAQQAICYLFSMPGVPCLVYPYWNNYKEIVKKVIYARKAAGVHSESVVEEDWAGDGSYGNNHYTARIKGAHGYIFLKMGCDCRPQDAPYNQPTDPEGRTWIKAWANDNAGVWYTTSDAQPSKYRLLVTCNGQTYYSNSVTENGQDLSYYATKDAKYQWQKYEMFQWKDVAGTTPAAVAENNVYTATFDMTNVAVTNVALYTGDYYIRTDEAEGGWNDYKKESHKFTYFNNASVAAGDAYRYYWVNNIAKSKEVNVHATVGNEINEHITNTLGNDEFTNNEGKVTGDANGINIRFSYEPTTNYLGRAMILGSTGDKYLNVVGSNIYKEKDCTTALDDAYYATHPADSKLGDISNWVYEKTVFVKITNDKPASNVVIKSVFKQTPSSAEQTQYMLGFQRDFYGNVTDDPVQYAVLDYGTTKSETAYCIRVIYDFKTNRLVGAWEPVDQEITDDWNIDADVLFKRTENAETAQITFANENDTISSLKNVLFIMEFAQDSGIIKGENFYWFSLPFDCHISSIYGVEDYVTLNEYGLPTQGTWGIQRYDGEERARKGWFIEDTKTFWKWMSKDEVLNAGEGYVLDFDKSCANFKTIGIEEACDDETDDECVDGKKTVQKAVLRLYFPSDKPGFSMTKTGSSEAVNYEDYTCNIKNRKAQDSNWRLLSPGNYSNTTIADEADIARNDNDSVLNKIPNFIYQYDRTKAANERYIAVKATDGFNYKSFSCYMAQFSGSVKWAQFTKADQTSVAPRYYIAPGEIQRATLKLVMTNSANETQDQTFIKLMPNATTGYDANRDLTKIVNSDMAQLYSVSEEVSYAANVLPVESQQIALTVVTPKAGTYTFAMPEGTDGVTATLIDAQDGSRTDLSMWDYTVDLNKGTFAGRFFIEIDIRKTPTQIDVTNPDLLDEDGNPIKTVKFLHEDQLYIQRGQHIYDATGKVVK